MATNKNLPTSPSSIKTKFTIKFLQAMKKLNNKSNKTRSQSMADRYRRYSIIRTAAYSSMASAVGPRRAWSRALLRNRGLHRYLMKRNRTHHAHFRKRIRVVRGNPRKNLLGFGQEDDLRELVPGGVEMGFCKLLNETAHYIQCLRAQVQVMTQIADHYST